MFWLLAFLEYKQFQNGYFSKLFFVAVSFNKWLCKENGKLFQNECIFKIGKMRKKTQQNREKNSAKSGKKLNKIGKKTQQMRKKV